MPFYLLPVSASEREPWVPAKPKGLTNSNSDYVSFSAEGPKKLDCPHQNCYAQMRGHYREYEIHCRPKQKPKAINLEDAYTFFNIMTQHNVVPEKVQLWEESDGIHCRIPRDAGPNSTIYAALTCYRWLDAHPPLVWQFLRILEQDVPRHPLQILPFLIDKHVGNCNHSFITTGGWAVKTKNYEAAINPTLGLAAKIFFDPGDERGKTRFSKDDVYVNDTVGEISRRISPKMKVPNPNEWGPRHIETPKFQLQRPEDGLHPALYELYQIPNITTEQIDEILSRLFTEESA